jgi:L-cysteine desulfhydrase
VLIDGAHAIGSVPINVNDIDADYYVANVHKWMFGLTGTAVFHCKNAELLSGYHDPAIESPHPMQLHHPLVSHDYRTGFMNECRWQGTTESIAWFLVPEAVEFYNKLSSELRQRLVYASDDVCGASAPVTGDLVVARYNRRKVLWAAQMLASAWQTRIAEPLDCISSLAMIHLPASISVHSEADALRLRHCIRERFKIECVTFYDRKSGLAFIRLSAQVYNSPDDYYRLRDAVLAVATTQYTDDNGIVQW